jgi:peptide deformylase
MVYPIVVYGSSVLRLVAKDIDRDYPDLQQLVSDMYETMYKSDGMGLAAPQIGLSIRLFVIDLTPLEDEYPELKNYKKTFINAHIREYEGEMIPMNEGCLSLPQIREDVNRNNRIRVEYYDENWEFHDEVFEGFPARVIQHEYDHLDGILFVDLIPPIRKKLLKRKLNDISRLKVKMNYKMKVIK